MRAGDIGAPFVEQVRCERRRMMSELSVQRSEPGDWIRCARCQAHIEGCNGAHGDWMHSGTRREACADGRGFAWPETAAEIDKRRKAT